MANFKTHLTVGIILGITCASLALTSSILSGWSTLTLIVLMVAIGSFLPDVDSDSALPFRIVFYSLGIILAIFTLVWVTNNYSNSWEVIPYLNNNPDLNLKTILIVGLPLLAFFATRFILGSTFKKFTKHRGIFHSIPMAIISILLTLTLLKNFSNFDSNIQLILSLSMGVGFLSHLILDEIYSTINFNGKKFHPNKNFGTALKYWSNSLKITLLTYFILFILFKINF